MLKEECTGLLNLLARQKIGQEGLEQNYDKHRIDDLSIVSYPQCWAWEFYRPVKFDPPLRILPQRHCRVWIHLAYPMAEKSIERLLTQAAVANDLDSLKQIGQCAGISCMEKGKNPYWRVLMKEHDILERFTYSKDSFDAQKDSICKALARMKYMAGHLDTVSCMQLPELKELLGKLGLSKVGQQGALKDRALKHLYHQDEAHVDDEMVQDDEDLATEALTVAPTTAAADLLKEKAATTTNAKAATKAKAKCAKAKAATNAKAKCAKVDVAEADEVQGSNGGQSNTDAHTSESKGPSSETTPPCKYFDPRQKCCTVNTL